MAFVTAIAVHIGWVVAHEPFSFDAWNVAVNSGAKPITLHRFFEFWKFEYTHSNPRIGQVFTYLTYKLEYFAVIATPLAYVALSLATVVLGTKRFPRANRDFALWAFAAGALWFALPQIGKTLFCRAYCANYVYTAAIQLWFLVPLRLGRGKPIPYFFAGVAAGMCNEHTGPTLIAFLVGYALWQRRKGEPNQLTMAGAAGAIVGFCIIFFAPGQGERYEGLANRVGLVGRVLQRGIVGNLDILRELLLASAPLLGLIVLVLLLTPDGERPRAQLRFIALAMVASIAVAVTIFVSPKLGPRFFYVGEALLLAGLVGLVDVVGSKRLVSGLVVLSVASAIYAGARTIPLYNRVKRASDARIAALEASKPGSVFIAEAFEQVDESWWFYGDDFRDPRKRDMVAKYFALAGVEHRAYDPKAPLGVSGARFVTMIDGQACGEPLALNPTKGFDLTALGQELTIAIQKLRTPHHHIEVGIAVDQPLPRPHIVVARWNEGTLEMHIGRIDRKGHSTTRDVRLPKELATPDVEVLVYRVNGEAKSIGRGHETPHYVPWKSGVYWILACLRDECFVIAATRHSA